MSDTTHDLAQLRHLYKHFEDRIVKHSPLRDLGSTWIVRNSKHDKGLVGPAIANLEDFFKELQIMVDAMYHTYQCEMCGADENYQIPHRDDCQLLKIRKMMGLSHET